MAIATGRGRQSACSLALVADQPYVRPPLEMREPPRGSPAYVYPGELMEPRAYLDRLRTHHLELTRRFLSAADGAIYSVDVFLAACMSRSYSIVDGFLDAWDNWNIVVAAPLLRMQLDTLVRVSYLTRAPRADEVAMEILRGGEFRKFKDTEGKTLTDKRLGQWAAPHHPWVADVYNATSGWVHLSPAHVGATWRFEESNDPDTLGHLIGATPVRPEQIPRSALQELIGAITKATEELFGYIETWESRKGLPLGEVRDIRTPEG
jgi:hypothetical protein